MPKVPSLKTSRLDEASSKRDYNRTHFAEAAERYDFATRALSLGGDARWKRKLIGALPDEAEAVLDLACGTGDLCFLLAERFPDAAVEGLDLTREMLDIAAHRNHYGERILFVEGDLCALPQDDNSMDVITGSYALRNAPSLKAALTEIHRVLKPGGTAAFLDFSKPPSPVAQNLQYRLLRFWGGLWGVLLHRNSSVHGYIAASLRTYPDRFELASYFRAAGLYKQSTQLFMGSMIELTILQK